jgi:WD40 repeat protein
MQNNFKFIFGCWILFVGLSLYGEKEVEAISYHQEIKPIFQANCNGCHQPAKQKGDYLMTDFDSLIEGGETGKPAVVPGKPQDSYLLSQIALDSSGNAEMPKGKNTKPLHEVEIAKIEQWIKEGARDDSPEGAGNLFTMDKKPIYQKLPLIRTLAYSPDGKLLAQNGFHEVLIADGAKGKLVSRLVGLSERIESIAFSPDGKKIAVAGGKPGAMGEVQIWDWEHEKLLLSHSITYDTLYGISWSPNGRYVAFGASDTAVRVIDSEDGKPILYMAGHDDWVRGTVFNANGKSIFSVSRDKTVKQTDVATERFIGNVTTHTPGVLNGGQNSIAVRPGKTELLVGGADGKAKLFRQATKAAPAGGGNPNQIREYKQQIGRIFAVCFNPKGNLCFAGSSLDGQGEVRCFEVDTGKQLWSRVFSHSPVYALAAAQNGKELAVGGYDGKIQILSLVSGETIRTFSVPLMEEGSEQKGKVGLSKAFALTELIGEESLPPLSTVQGLTTIPKEIIISSPVEYAQILVSAGLGGGQVSDVTRQVRWSGGQNLGRIDNRGLFTPQKNGKGMLTASLDNQTVQVKVSVSGLGKAYHPDFISEVNPVISKLGCNAGTCHGAKDGKNGFKLSLRGYDALYDIRGFTDDMASRRVNVAAPERSLMLLKATGNVPHEGGQLTQEDSRYHRIIKTWISNGALVDMKARRVKEIKLYPQNPVVQEIGATQQFRVVAFYEDGLIRDVTREAFVTSGNGEVAEHDALSLMTTLRRGEAPILARFEGRYAATTLTVMGDRSGFVWKKTKSHNRVDDLVSQKWKRMKIQPSSLAGDLDFLRRLYLDLTGLPPTDAKVASFLDDKRPVLEKRNELIDQLIGNEEYVEHWSNKWADMLQVNGKFLGRVGATALRDWIENEIRQNTPYDEFARKVLTASGSNKENPAASYYKILRTPEDTMENTTHLFLATRFNCNKCHDHPFERWTQDQYYEMAAHFAQFKLEKDPAAGKQTIGKTAVERAKPLYEIVKDVPTGDVKHEKTGQVTAPDFPYPAKFENNESLTRRERLARWMTSSDNQYFARSYVNRIWGYLFGIGIIEPIDDIRAGNPPSNPELLDYLEKEFISSGFDIQHVIRLICQSRTYQLSVETNQWNEDDTINFSHVLPRRLPAETLLDAVYTVTGSQTRFPGVPAGTRAASLPDVGISLSDGFLGTFGRPARETSCECERSGELQLGPIMALVSGPTVNNAISDPNNAINKLAKEEIDNRDLINRLFLRILNRPASDDEINRSLGLFTEKIQEDHQNLVSQLKEAEFSIKDWLEKEEAARAEAITQAKNELASYKQHTADAVKQANDKRNARIQATKDALATFDKTLPARLKKWERDFSSGKSAWRNVNLSKISSKMPGVKFEAQKDGSVFVAGRSAKGSYKIESTSALNRVTGIRIEAMNDNRLPRKGPGRAPNDGNFVLSELEVTVAPTNDLKYWKELHASKWESTSIPKPWKLNAGSKVNEGNQSVILTKSGKDTHIQLSEFFHVGPFTGVSFDQKAGPELDTEFLREKTYEHAGNSLQWVSKPEWKDGELYGSVFSGENSANYLVKEIEVTNEMELPISLGSDDGIKVFLNGKTVLAKNIGRGAAPDQDQVVLNLKKGKNTVLLKIHNGGGPSGFYFKSGIGQSKLPGFTWNQKIPAGSFVLTFQGKSSSRGEAKLVLEGSPTKANKNDTFSTKLKGDQGWHDYRIDFILEKQLAGLQFLLPERTEIKSVGIYRNGLPQKLTFENALATFSQNGYPVASAIDGKVAPAGNGWAISPQMGKNHYASFQVKTPATFDGPTDLEILLKQEFQSGQHSLGRFRVAVTDLDKPISYGLPEEVVQIFGVDRDKRSPEQNKKISDAFKNADPQRVSLLNAMNEAKKPIAKDSKLTELESAVSNAEKPLPLPSEVTRLRRALSLSEKQLANKRLIGAQDLSWALINTPAFLFNR